MLFFEHKHLYRRIKGEVPDGDITVAVRQGTRRSAGRRPHDRHLGRDGAHGHAAAEQAEAEHDISVEVIDLRTIVPWDREAVCRPSRDRQGVVLHEDTRTAGFGAEIAATIAEEVFEDLDAPVVRITAPDSRCRSRRPSSKRSFLRSTTSWPPSTSSTPTDRREKPVRQPERSSMS